MKNTWKGLIFGAFAGTAIGVLLDAIESGGEKAAYAGSRFKVKAQDAVESLEGAAHRAGDWVKDKDLPNRLHDVQGKIRDTATDLASSSPVERVRHAVERS